MRKRTGVAAALLLAVAMVLGGTLFRAPLADAAAILQVRVVNPTTAPVPVAQQGTAPVAQQGTADVNVTNGSLDVAVQPQAPVTSGGQWLQVDAGQTDSVAPQTASAIVVHYRDGATDIILQYDGAFVARFPGPGPLALALTQPLRFNAVQCAGADGGFCDLGWAGSAG